MIPGELNLYLESCYYLITILGVPVAIYVYLMQRVKDRRVREYELYESLNDKYLEFLQLCLANPDLNIVNEYYSLGRKKPSYTSEQKVRELLIYEYLISLLERAYLTFYDQHSDQKKKRLSGWIKYMEDWMQMESFRSAWIEHLGSQWHEDFQNKMDDILKDLQKKVVEVKSL